MQETLIIPKGIRFGQVQGIEGKSFEVMPPAYDLVRKDIVRAYLELGREKIIDMSNKMSARDIIMVSKRKIADTQLSLF